MTPAEIAAAIRAWPALADELEAMGMRVAAEAVRVFPGVHDRVNKWDEFIFEVIKNGLVNNA